MAAIKQEAVDPAAADDLVVGRSKGIPWGRLSDYSLPLMLAVLVVVFSILEPDTFATVDNLKTILASNSVVAILALGALFPLIVGEFDLSVGANLGLSLILCTGLASQSGFGAPEAIAVAILASTLVGLVNGLLVARGGIDAFVSTLGMSSLITGGVVWYSNGETFSTNIPSGLISLGRDELLGIPLPVWFLAGVVLVTFYLLNTTPLGKHLYAVGGSREASRLSGLNVARLTVFAFVASGLLAGVAGVLQAAQLGSGSPAVGPSYLLPAFAAVFLGATSFRRGSFNVPGTVTAAFVIAVGINGLISIGAPFYIAPVFTGVALLTAALAARAFKAHRKA